MKKKVLSIFSLLLAATIFLTPAAKAYAASSAEMLKTMSFTTKSKVYDSSSKKVVTQTIYHNNILKDRKLFKGIDVSWHQAANQKTTKIDWAKAHADGIDFAFVRIGARKTSSAGDLYEDTSANSHITSALQNNINVGVYFFSQALTVEEAKAEAKYALKILGKYNWNITLPVVFDYEFNNRLTSKKLSKSTMTKICDAFCSVIEDAGYTPAIYANYTMFKSYLTTSTLSKKYPIWLARYKYTATSNTLSGSTAIPYADITYPYEFWQFSSSGRVSGYSGNLDCNYWYKNTNIKTNALGADSQTTSSIDLSWDEAGDAHNYIVYRYNNDTQSYKRVGSTTNTSFSDSSLDSGSDYKYKVRCYWTIGGTKYYGKYSDIITTSTKPNKVSGVDFEVRNSTNLTLSWDSVKGATKYRIYKYDKTSNSYKKIDEVDGNTTTYKVTGLTSATEHSFKVRAVRTSNGSTYLGSYSDVFTTITKPLKVSKLTATSSEKKTATISFSKVKGADGYNVYRYDSSKEKWVRIKSITDGSTSFKQTGLTSKKTYKYRVRAFINYNETTVYGLYSDAVSVKVK